MEKTLLDHAKDARIEEMQIELHHMKQTVESVWGRHLQLCEESSQQLQRIALLEAELEKMRI